MTIRLGFVLIGVVVFLPVQLRPEDQRKDPDAIGSRDVSRGLNFYSMEKELALGRELAHEVELHSMIVGDPAVTEYVNRVGQNLVRNSDVSAPFTIKVVDNDEVNAFALPGGFLFVNTGLITTAESEAELAGVMAHEVAHVAGRHVTRQATRLKVLKLALIPFMLVGGGTAGYAVQQAAMVALPMSLLRFSRGFEREADLLGLQYLYKAGYDPLAVIDFFERLQSLKDREPGMIAKMFLTHPTTGSRIRRAQKYVGKFLPARPQYVVNTSEFDQVRARLIQIQQRNRRQLIRRNRPRGLIRRPPPAPPREEKQSSSDGGADERPTLKRRN